MIDAEKLQKCAHFYKFNIFLDEEQCVNSEIELSVQSLTLVFNKPEYELAGSTVSRLNTHVTLRDGNIRAQGQLGSLVMQDLSPHGSKFRERFVTNPGKQALEFYVFK